LLINDQLGRPDRATTSYGMQHLNRRLLQSFTLSLKAVALTDDVDKRLYVSDGEGFRNRPALQIRRTIERDDHA
jgi:hypothetical protein